MITHANTHYDLYNLGLNGHWNRIYRELDLQTAKSNLSIELSEPTQKGRWMVKEVTTTVETRELSLFPFLSAEQKHLALEK